MKAAVRQMRGPGMNLGLKKPRFGFTEPKPYVPSKATKAALQDGGKGVSKGASNSYLPESKPGRSKKPVTPKGNRKTGSKML